MMPGITNCPLASITSAPWGLAMDWPISAILPSRIRIEPCSIVPCDTVSIVAFWIRRIGGAAASGGSAPKALDTTIKFNVIMTANVTRRAYHTERALTAHLPLRLRWYVQRVLHGLWR